MESRRSQPLFLGILIIALGIVWLLNNLGVTRLEIGELFSTYWPLIFVAWGIDVLVRGWSGERLAGSNVVNGIILVGIGALILGRNLGYYQINFSLFWKILWPVVLILVGWSLLRGAVGYGRTHWAVMSGLELKNHRWRLEDASYIAFMGGVDLDLSVADIPNQETTLNLTAVMGGIDVKVPADLEVECQGSAILGGVTFFHEEAGGIIANRSTVHVPVQVVPAGESIRVEPAAGGEATGEAGPAAGNAGKKRVRIYCRTLMGGIEIKEAPVT